MGIRALHQGSAPANGERQKRQQREPGTGRYRGADGTAARAAAGAAAAGAAAGAAARGVLTGCRGCVGLSCHAGRKARAQYFQAGQGRAIQVRGTSRLDQ